MSTQQDYEDLLDGYETIVVMRNKEEQRAIVAEAKLADMTEQARALRAAAQGFEDDLAASELEMLAYKRFTNIVSAEAKDSYGTLTNVLGSMRDLRTELERLKS